MYIHVYVYIYIHVYIHTHTYTYVAVGQFQGAAAATNPALRLVIMLQEDQKLEVEALNAEALDMWAIALQVTYFFVDTEFRRDVRLLHSRFFFGFFFGFFWRR